MLTSPRSPELLGTSEELQSPLLDKSIKYKLVKFGGEILVMKSDELIFNFKTCIAIVLSIAQKIDNSSIYC